VSADVSDQELTQYFGHSDGNATTRMLMVFAFRLNQALAVSLARDGEEIGVGDSHERLDPNSLLTWFKRIRHAPRECEDAGSGDHEIIDSGRPCWPAVRAG
jgi:hypothetical protein